MLFEEVLMALRSGARFYRETWGNDGNFIFMFPGTEDTIVPRDSLHSKMLGRLTANMLSRIDRKMGDAIIIGWTPNADDLFADDWVEKDA